MTTVGVFQPTWQQKLAPVWQFQPVGPGHTWISAALSKPRRRDESYIQSERSNFLLFVAAAYAVWLPDICHPAVAERSCCQSTSHLLPVTVAQHHPRPPTTLTPNPITARYHSGEGEEGIAAAETQLSDGRQTLSGQHANKQPLVVFSFFCSSINKELSNLIKLKG